MSFRPTPTYVHAPPSPSTHAKNEHLTVYPPFMSDAALEKWRAARRAPAPPPGDQDEEEDAYFSEEDEWW